MKLSNFFAVLFFMIGLGVSIQPLQAQPNLDDMFLDVNVNQATKNGGNTPLYIASQNNHAKIVEILVAANEINVNQANDTGNTPLSIASHNASVFQNS